MNQFSISTSLARWILQTDLTEKAIADARYGLAVEVSAGDLLLNDAATVVAGLDVPGVQVPAVSAWSPLIRAALGGATPDDLALAEEFSWAELGTMEVEQIRPPRDQMRDEAVERAGSIRSGALQRALITISIAVLAVLASVAIALLVARRITEPLRRLTKAANDVRVELPRLVEQVAVPGQGPELDFARIPVEDDDEVGQLASAFNDVNETTLDIAREQALLRGSIAEMFFNVARRDQALLSKQLAFLDELERSEEDPNTLANLFRLDHFATRMRRNAESLLVLAGIESGRRVRNPMPLSDVIRTASSEIEQYERIQLEIQTDPSILGHHALITAHLLAELLENATEFSEPGTPVMVRESEDADWVTIEIVDTGLGMSAEEIDEANRKTAVYAGGEIVGAERLGLYVVGRLAHRLGASVRFANLDSAVGIRVGIRLPKTLFLAEVDRTLPEPTDPLSADTRAATEAWVTPDLDVARVNDEMNAFRDQEPPLVTAVDLDSLTDGLTATGMPRRRSRAVDLSAPAPSEALTDVGFESNLDHVSPPDGVAGTSEGGVEWNPSVVPSAGGLPSRTARDVEANLVPEAELASPVPVPRRASLFSNFRTREDLDAPGDQTDLALEGADSPLPIVPGDTTPTEVLPTRASVRRAREIAKSARTEKPAQTEQDTAHSMSEHTAEPVLEPSPLFEDPAEQTGLPIPGLVDADLVRNDEGASPSQHQFNTKSHFSDPLSPHENVADRTEPAFPVEPLPTSGPAASTVPEVNPFTNFEPFTAHNELPAYAEVVGNPTVRESKPSRRGRLGRKRRSTSRRRDNSASTGQVPTVPDEVHAPAMVPMFEPEPKPQVWHQAVSEANVYTAQKVYTVSEEGQYLPEDQPEESGVHPVEWAEADVPFDQEEDPVQAAEFFSASKGAVQGMDPTGQIDTQEQSFVLPEPGFTFTVEPNDEGWSPSLEEANTFVDSAVRQSQWSSDDDDHSSVAARLALRGGNSGAGSCGTEPAVRL